ncbi:ankyrin repeat family [Chlorella sorokiniana]|uniref:Ankyrin repeat family n=1 Tax=Chlorella sorokiniana TaxID=3076 RepID=A0A2P6TN33_CHLSO|nr:ankyrin repeat family [Chlorella sorokiniana]|eukprot:PRW45725.1 ankyrin repeat family [Chlorella sorokiniana]
MAAPKAVVLPSENVPGAWQVVVLHFEEKYVVEALGSEETAALICDALTIRASVDDGRDLDELQLRSTLGPPWMELLGPEFCVDATAAVFQEIVEQLNDCAIEAAEGQGESAGEGLLLAALSCGHDEAAQLLLAAAPSLAQADGALDLAVQGALDCAAHSASAPVALLLAALPDPHAAVEALPVKLLFEAAESNGVELLQQLLEVAPSIATAEDRPLDVCFTTTMWAALHGCAEALAVLIEYKPAAATATNENLQHALHTAARKGSVPCVEVLLAAAPQLATTVDGLGWTASHVAAQYGNLAALEVLLRHAPDTLTATTLAGSTLMHAAAQSGNVGTVQWLMAAAPLTVQAASSRGAQPVHAVAELGHTAVSRALLEAAPACAMARDDDGWMPAHLTAINGHVPALSVPLTAAPAAAGSRTFEGYLPIDVAVEHMEDADKQPATVRALLPYGDARTVLRALRSGGPQLAPLFADFVLARLPLSPAFWALLPEQCPRLGRALPAALECSVEQAASLVRHLPPADRLRLRTAALSLGREQRRLRCHLPPMVLYKVLSLFDA